MSIVQHRRYGPRPVRYAIRRDGAPHAEMQQIRARFFDPARLNAAWRASDHDDATAAAAQWQPSVDVKEEADGFVIYADLPGVEPNAIEVQMDQGILWIRAERASGADGQDGRYPRVERQSGTFQRRFALPDSADAEGITAHGHNGVLEVRIPKKPETTPRRIHVVGNASRDNAPKDGAPEGGTPTVQ